MGGQQGEDVMEKGHKHYWEYRGGKRFSAGVWVSSYVCRCGEVLRRGR